MYLEEDFKTCGNELSVMEFDVVRIFLAGYQKDVDLKSDLWKHRIRRDVTIIRVSEYSLQEKEENKVKAEQISKNCVMEIALYWSYHI
jgi:hypothetical protein